jgi:hypothetical protein
MTSLRDLQRNFISDCLSGELSDENVSLAPDIDTGTISAKGRMEIYRESAIGNIITPMQLTYPVVEKLVGNDFFRATCRQYIQNHWPETGNMDDYGDDFSFFLAEFEPAKNIPYLSDVARLEWLFHESSIANDQSPSDWSSFADLSEDEFEHVQIGLHPSVRFFSSMYPVKEIWDMNQETADSDQALDLDQASGGHLVIVRQEFKTELYPIETAERAFLRALETGTTLFDAVDSAIEIDEACDMQALMTKHLGNGVLCTFTKKTNLHSTS